MNARDDINRNPERAAPTDEPRRDTEIHVDAMEAGPAGVIEREVTVRRTTAERGGEVETDRNLETRVKDAAENALHKAGDALQGAAPTVGRGAEMAMSGTGAALSGASGVVGTIIGKIAGRVGGWWESAREAVAEISEEDRKACMVHFEAYEVRPSGMTFEHALPGYTLGYVAARNPGYRGRRFEDIEPDLRHGFTEGPSADYAALRDFARFSYERGIGGR